MDRKDTFLKFYVKGGILLIVFVLAIIRPGTLEAFFNYGFNYFKVYHLLWLLAVLILIKRLIPGLNQKITLGKIYERNYIQAGDDNHSKQRRLTEYVKKMNFGAVRSAVYWILLVLDIGFWRLAGLLDTMWLIIIVVFFIFMDQFCVTIWCPFKAIIRHKCCNACRINNWGYLMAFSPLIFVPSFWTYSILLLSVVIIIQWEYVFYKHPERFFELYNAKLMCKNCLNKCDKFKIRH